MARVVQRSGPPYLAIVFVFLFLIAAVLAGLAFNQSQNYAEQLNRANNTLDSLAKRSELNDQVMSRHKARAQANNKSAIGQYREDQAAFIKAIAGADVPAEEAIEMLAKLNEMSENAGLFDYLQQNTADMQALVVQFASTQQTLMALEQKTQADAEAAAKAAQQLEDALTEAKRAQAEAQAKLDAISDSYSSDVAAANEQWSKRTADLQAQLATREDEIRALEQKTRELQKTINDLANPEGMQVKSDATMGADGKIVRLTNSKDVVYINIGSQQNVRIGLPFIVYSKRTGVIPDSDGKARIIVKNVYDVVAECQVLKSDPADPISVDDPIANVAYSVHSHPIFVVGGDFDLDGNGMADRNGTDTIKSMIRRFGGIVADEVTVDVDYVVMGSMPTRLPSPTADAPASERALWDANEKEIAHYKQMLQKSVDYNKAVLNTGRFLTFIGFTPEVIR